MGVAAFWDGLCAGRSGASVVTHIDTEGISSKIACKIDNYDAEKYFSPKDARKTDEFVQFAIIASREALASSGLQITDELSPRVGAVIGCGIGALEALEREHSVLLEKGAKRVSPLIIPRIITNMAAGMVAIDLNLKGPNYCVVTACASATHSIGDAYHVIKRDEADVMFAGGTESAITPLGMGGFSNMRALSSRNDEPQRASRPFDRDRDGFVMGEGAGIIVLEEYEHAKARGAQILAEMIGFGMSCDAHHITAPDPAGDGGVRAMRAALKSARINGEDVDYINAHGTSTPLNDKLESLGIETLFGDHAMKLAVSSNKSMVGHLLGAAGGVEAAATVLTLKNGIIPPTINYETPDPDCRLDYVPNVAREQKTRIAMSNSLGFGGHNCSIVIKKFEG
jgi:3-oxoacyl-[acyl-carrier-protein] synthase II